VNCPVIDARVALRAARPLLHENVPGNLLLGFRGRRRGGDRGCVPARGARSRAHFCHSRVVAIRWNRVQAWGCLIQIQGFFSYTRARGVTRMRRRFTVLACRPRKIRVIAEEVGGGSACAQHLPGILRAPARGEQPRPAGEVGRHALRGIHRRRAGARHRAPRRDGARRFGRILGMRFEFVCNLGAYLAFTGSFVNTVTW